MLKIKVEHKIGDIVDHKITDLTYLVIGYAYIESGGVQYICVCSANGKQTYCYGYELCKPKNIEIGFTLK